MVEVNGVNDDGMGGTETHTHRNIYSLQLEDPFHHVKQVVSDQLKNKHHPGNVYKMTL